MSKIRQSARNEVTQYDLMSLLTYNASTGAFFWRVARGPNSAGSKAGAVNNLGYVTIGINGKKIAAHRLAWLYMYGELPAADVDHINGHKADNRIANLRLATRSENMMNVGPRKNNKSGVKGVTWRKDILKWTASLWLNGKQHRLGVFDQLNDAASAVEQAKRELHGRFASK